MALADIIALSCEDSNKKSGMSEERLRAQLDNLRFLISYFREYPDLFVDFIKGEDCNFKFFFYQRVFLRQVMRYRFVYATYPRAYEDAPIQFNKNCGQTFLIAWTLKLIYINTLRKYMLVKGISR